jgi:hypothetical protein
MANNDENEIPLSNYIPVASTGRNIRALVGGIRAARRGLVRMTGSSIVPTLNRHLPRDLQNTINPFLENAIRNTNQDLRNHDRNAQLNSNLNAMVANSRRNQIRTEAADRQRAVDELPHNRARLQRARAQMRRERERIGSSSGGD